MRIPTDDAKAALQRARERPAEKLYEYETANC